MFRNMNLRLPLVVLVSIGSTVVGAGCAGAVPQTPPRPPPTAAAVDNQIIGTRAQGTARELRQRGEEALLAQRWQDAVDAFEALLGGNPAATNDPRIVYDLAVAYEGLGARERARERYRDVARRFATSPDARNALVREISLDAYLEDWSALGEAAESILKRADMDPADRMLGLGARALARLESGDHDDVAALHDVEAGLDLADEHKFGATGRLPVAVAMLKFAHGEIRRMRSEKISLDPPGDDFLMKLELRCQGLLDAQSAYADAIRASDVHWAAMSGYRVGEMYRSLHQHLMLLPPPPKAKTEQDKQLAYGIMHVRYRVLLEKGIEMMKRTLALGEHTGVASAWMTRAETAKAEMETSLEQEKATIASLPYTEEELQRTLVLMKRNADKKAAKANDATQGTNAAK